MGSAGAHIIIYANGAIRLNAACSGKLQIWLDPNGKHNQIRNKLCAIAELKPFCPAHARNARGLRVHAE
ncbi:hypothetical protein D3C86_2252250 [compost metagenome]